MAHCHPLPPLHIGNLSCRPLHTQSTPSQEEERRRTQHTRNEHPFKLPFTPRCTPQFQSTPPFTPPFTPPQEEERRLTYVALTRARRRLVITWSEVRLYYSTYFTNLLLYYSNITILLYYHNIISSRARAPPSRHLVFGGLCILPDYFTTLLLYLSDTTLLYYYTTLLIHPLARARTVVSSSRVRSFAVVASVVYCLDENNPSTTHSTIPSLYQGSVSPHWTRSHGCS